MFLCFVIKTRSHYCIWYAYVISDNNKCIKTVYILASVSGPNWRYVGSAYWHLLDQSHKCNNAPVFCPTIHPLEQNCLHISAPKWCIRLWDRCNVYLRDQYSFLSQWYIVEYGIGVPWHLWGRRTFRFQSGIMWEMGQVQCGICEIGILYEHVILTNVMQ